MAGSSTARATESRRDGTINVDGRQITYAEYGSPDGAPVLFFHRTPGSRLLASLLDERAADDEIRVIAPERPGVGRSDPAAKYGLLDWSHDIALFVNVLDFDSIGVVGFSGGGPHALAVGAGIEKGHLSKTKLSGIGLLAGAGPPDAPQRDIKFSNQALGIAVRSFPRIATGLFKFGTWIAHRRTPAATAGLYSDRPVGEGKGKISPNTARVVHKDYCEASNKEVNMSCVIQNDPCPSGRSILL